MQLDNSNNANNLYNSIKNSDLSNNKITIIDIKLNNNSNNNSKKDNNS
jgi:hypothetical protein